MEAIDAAYWRILEAGIIALRDAASSGDISRCKAEAEHIHNIPSLIGENNIHRHLFYAAVERKAYIDWVSSTGREDLRTFVSLVYAPEWAQIDEFLKAYGEAEGGSWGSDRD